MLGIVLSLIFVVLAIASACVAFFGKQLKQRGAAVATSMVGLSFIASIWVLIHISAGHAAHFELPLPPNYAPDWFRLSVYIDRLSAIMISLITLVSTIIHAYSINYLQGDRGYQRFFALLGTLTLVLVAMVCSGNMFLLFLWWQLVSWLLYLLLSYNFTQKAAIANAFKSLFTLRIGDIAFFIGVLLTYRIFGTLQFPDLFDRIGSTSSLLHLWSGGPGISAITVITLFIFVGAMTKSAQYPFHGWLPDTMDAPTPVSAFMHAGIVNAGGFVINRLAPMYGASTNTLHVVLLIGLVTTIIGTAMMLTKSDIKTKLGYSTVGQMGFMIMECGLGAFALAIFHLIAHGIFKATSFLHAGNVIHDVRNEPHLPQKNQKVEKALELPWATGVLITLVVPLLILLGAHTLIGISMYQGSIIFLFFAWVTSSQAIMTLYSLKTYGSWKAVFAMVFAVAGIIVTYLWAAESFTEFLYPEHGIAAAYFRAASLPLWIFDLFVGLIVLLFLSTWVAIRPDVKMSRPIQKRIEAALVQLYILLWSGLHAERIFTRTWYGCSALVKKLDAVVPEWLP